MERRSFLKLLAGTAAATAVPSVLIAAEEKQGDYSVRYIRAYDAFRAEFIERVDVTYGFALEVPKAIPQAEAISGLSRAYVIRAIKTMKRANVPLAAIAALESEVPNMRPGSNIGVTFHR